MEMISSEVDGYNTSNLRALVRAMAHDVAMRSEDIEVVASPSANTSRVIKLLGNLTIDS